MAIREVEALRHAGGLPVNSLARLENRVSDVLHYRASARINLRIAVQRLLIELRDVGASNPTARRFMAFVLEHHPEVEALDRVSVVTGARESERLRSDVASWIDEIHCEPPSARSRDSA